ncbi:biogenesis of lysosome-related organelles complex 1 subunit 4 isoform X1 [Diprion similis]|uniref:biogenesis of lysosome-related organelles complex 1 subunit 4 isoform X1 n=1 Tax=Diprion similis TaxID=362088 RepID=UPI001EF90C4C|nr:biogenesis of lysosome-related organelles complex 1 subunit 4 isoform X1 [Diprion similis]
MIDELAADHAAYAKIDLTSQVRVLHNTIEDMMMRLEEFESIFGMVQSEGAECLNGQIPRVQVVRQELTSLCRRIDALEHVVGRANVTLVSLEAAVDAAEADLGVPDSLFSKLNPLSFFKKVQEPATSTRMPIFNPPVLYKTEEFFNPE